MGAAALAVLAPGGTAEAMKLAFASVARGSLATGEKGGEMAGPTTVYELRIYHVMPGKIEDLVARFRDHTMKLFANHGIKSVAYWRALDEPVKSSTFFYILEHPSRGSGGSKLENFPGRSSMEGRKSEIGRKWPPGREG